MSSVLVLVCRHWSDREGTQLTLIVGTEALQHFGDL